ncbi:MAG: DUF4381 family protein [Planctomycetota bacterium]|jgi:hypothetical protein|nr:DUF4381 family protein [Planctomycetota bacterium]MDP6763515.1 DUF4381 family protein [Planctomycetota bacterium]MDP6990798.1 DUF4381 family protein [Planctomycetota bacterium]
MPALLASLAAVGLVAQAADVRVRSACEPAEAEIGQPIDCSLWVEHPGDVLVRLRDDAPGVDDSWVVEGEPRTTTTTDPAAIDRRVTRVAWTLRSLEPGERAVALPAVRLFRDGAPAELETPPATLAVLGSLSEGEDEPRPAAGFRPAPDWERPPVAGAFVLAGLVLAGALTAWWWARTRRRVRSAEGEPTTAERLAELRGRLGELEGDAQLHYELTALVRAAADARAGEGRQAQTDEEWLASLSAVDGETRQRLGEFLAECSAVKYGQERPTRWAVEATVAAAEDLVAVLAGGEEEAA